MALSRVITGAPSATPSAAMSRSCISGIAESRSSNSSCPHPYPKPHASNSTSVMPK